MTRDPASVKQEAIAWYAHLCSGDATREDQEEHRRWCAAHADNRAAWARFEAMRQSFAGLPTNVAAATLDVASKERRRTLRNAVVLLTVGGAGGVGFGIWHGGGVSPAIWMADVRTRIGEQRSLTLSDGSLLMLNTDTAVDIIFDERQRLIRLHTGEILVETAAHRRGTTDDANINPDTRPLSVATRHGRVRALGTRFTVRRFDDRSEATVIDQAVEVRPEERNEQKVVISAGQRVAFSERELFAVRPADVLDDWSTGSLVINDWRLGDLLAELARYRRGRIDCDPQAAQLRVSGAFPLLDTDRALEVLVRSLPLKITFITRYWVRVAVSG